MLKEAGSTQKAPMSVKQLLDLTGRVAIITGGSIGLGRQMAEGLAEMGASLVLCARKAERCREAAEELEQLGIKAMSLACDVRNQASVQELVDAKKCGLTIGTRLSRLISLEVFSVHKPSAEL
jgi:FlaA1/EpsC-like NDP-sugar epimerase